VTQEGDPQSREEGADISRRGFLGGTAFGIAAATAVAATMMTGQGVEAAPPDHAGKKGPPPRGGHKNRVLLKGGIVLSLDPAVGDFARADVLVEGKKIVSVGPNLGSVGNAQVVDCRGMIVMPGFITTHHHQYETLMRSIIPEGLLQGAWPQESYNSVVQNIWTAGRIGSAASPTWDLGRPPMDPEDVYLGELVASLSQITEGITMTCDTSQSSHTPEYTDAMIEGLIDSGQRALFDYSGGTNRGGGYEYPGKIGDYTTGVGRLRNQQFSSDDQLVTLGLAAGPTTVTNPDGTQESYTGWQLARAFGAHINNHNVGSPQTVINAAADPRNDNGGDWSDVTLVHCVRWQDTSAGQFGVHGTTGTPASTAMQIFADRGGHISIANLIEAQMRHGAPPFQLALNYGILPSLSPDVDTNMTTDPFSLMRGAFIQQRGQANDLAFPISNPDNLALPQLVTCRQVIEMCTIAGAAGNGVLNKVGTLTPGKEADIVVLDTQNINIAPMNNVPGTVVTMMNPRHVKHVMIAGKFKYWNYELVGVNVDHLVRKLGQAYEKVLSRIQGPAVVGAIPPGNNSQSSPYRPNFLGSCCHNGQNTTAPQYVLRP